MAIRYKLSPAFTKIIELEINVVSASAPICPFLIGEPGIGKSSIVKYICEENDWIFHELLCNQLGDRTDLTGCRTVKETDPLTKEEVWTQIFFPHKSVQAAITDAKNNPDKKVILFLDEVNRCGSDITSSVLSFITARTIGTYTFPENIYFIVAGNDKGNVTALDSASISRFALFTVEPDATAWIAHEESVGQVSSYIRAVLNQHPDLIVCKELNTVTTTVQDDDGDSYENEYNAFNDSAEGFNQFTTPRTLSGLNALLCKLSFEEISAYNSEIVKDADSGEDMTMLQAWIYSHIGRTAFAQYLMEAIVTAINSNTSDKRARATTPPTEPDIYKKLGRCKDRDTRLDMLRSVDSEGLSELLVYMMFDKGHDNAALINDVCLVFPDEYLNMKYFGKLSNLFNQEMLDENNTKAFTSNDSPISRNMCIALFNAQ